LRGGGTIDAINLEEEREERETRPAIEFEVHVNNEPATVRERVEEAAGGGEKEHDGKEHTDGIGTCEPSERMPGGDRVGTWILLG
jgi:hypothetical protein